MMYLFEEINQEIYRYYLDTLVAMDEDKEAAIWQTALSYNEDITFIEDIIKQFEYGCEMED